MMGFESSLEAAVAAVRQAQACTQNLKISLTQHSPPAESEEIS
jgi:hypothetical protein